MTEVRTITEDEIPAFVAATRIGFAGRAEEGLAELYRDVIVPDRTLAALDGGAVVGTARSWAADVTVPGGAEVPAAAVTAVTVMPTHRRRGLLTEMMRAQLDDVADRGEPIAVLVAAEAPIYGRFGYGPAVWETTIHIDARRTRVTSPPAPRTLRFVEADEARKLAPPIYDASRRARSGTLSRPDTMWDAIFGQRATDEERRTIQGRYTVVTSDDDGVPDGWVTYQLKSQWENMRPTGTVVVHELCAASDAAYAALWHYVLTQDWCIRVEAERRAVDEPLPWLVTDQRQVVVQEVSDFVWTRILDVPRALAARTYGVPDRLVVEVVDPFRPASAGRFALDGSAEGASCTPTDGPADLTIDTRELGAAYLGGTPLFRAAAAGRVQEHTAGAVARFDRMFTTVPAPWCSTMF